MSGSANDARSELGETIDLIGWLLWNSGKPAEALPEFRTALPIHQRLTDEEPGATKFRLGLGRCHYYLGQVLPLTRKAEEGEAELRASLQVLQKLLDENRSVTWFSRYVALCRNYYGDLLLQVGKPGLNLLTPPAQTPPRSPALSAPHQRPR